MVYKFVEDGYDSTAMHAKLKDDAEAEDASKINRYAVYLDRFV